jgi:hypothetical protein
MLSRKYLSDTSHTDAVCKFFIDIASTIVENLPKNFPGLTSLLPDLLDPSKSFYVKHGFPKPAVASPYFDRYCRF